MLRHIPVDVLMEIVNQNADWLLRYLKAHTLFDVDRIGFVMTLGRRAAIEELERRERESFEQVGAPPVDGDPFDLQAESIFGGVIDVSMEDSTPAESFEETSIPEYPAGTECGTFEPAEDEPSPPHVPVESPNDWVTQDRVPKRDWDQHRWLSPDGKVVIDWHLSEIAGTASKMHGDMNVHGNRLEIRCKRFELPSIIPAPSVVDVDNEPF